MTPNVIDLAKQKKLTALALPKPAVVSAQNGKIPIDENFTLQLDAFEDDKYVKVSIFLLADSPFGYALQDFPYKPGGNYTAEFNNSYIEKPFSVRSRAKVMAAFYTDDGNIEGSTTGDTIYTFV